jgi:hypothetical protein
VVALAGTLGVDCLAFQEGPSEIPEPRRGRPPKAEGPAEPEAQEPKRTRKGKGK